MVIRLSETNYIDTDNVSILTKYSKTNIKAIVTSQLFGCTDYDESNKKLYKNKDFRKVFEELLRKINKCCNVSLNTIYNIILYSNVYNEQQSIVYDNELIINLIAVYYFANMIDALIPYLGGTNVKIILGLTDIKIIFDCYRVEKDFDTEARILDLDSLHTITITISFLGEVSKYMDFKFTDNRIPIIVVAEILTHYIGFREIDVYDTLAFIICMLDKSLTTSDFQLVAQKFLKDYSERKPERYKIIKECVKS